MEELLSLDLLTLREHTESAGDRLDAESHAVQLRESLAVSLTCSVRRRGALVAYAMVHQVSGSSWFVGAFNTHPAHRNAPVMKELLLQLRAMTEREGIAELRSHVYKTNRASMAFHRRLGFQVTRENDKAVEFFASLEALASNRFFQRAPLFPATGPDAPRDRRRPPDEGPSWPST